MKTGLLQRFKEKKDINYMELTPVIAYEFKENEAGKVTVLIPKFTTWLWSRLLMPIQRQKYIKLKLDEIGSSVWKAIDGERKVSDICNLLKEKFGERIEPTEERVTRFLTQLHINNCITFKEISSSGKPIPSKK